jgi:hypothetical protein
MNASSEEPGTELGFQLAATFQAPPLVLVQVIGAAPAGKMKAVPRRQSASLAARTSDRRAESNTEQLKWRLRKADP